MEGPRIRRYGPSHPQIDVVGPPRYLEEKISPYPGSMMIPSRITNQSGGSRFPHLAGWYRHGVYYPVLVPALLEL